MTDHRLSRRGLLRLSALAGAGALLAACAPQVVKETVVVTQKETVVVEKKETVVVEKVVTSAPAKTGPATVRWGSWAVGDPFFQQLQDQFQAQNPEIKIQQESAPWSEYWDRMQVQMAAGEASDVLWMSGAMFLNFVQKNFFLEMTPLADAAGLKLDDYFLQANVFTYNGKVYAWPWFHTVSSCWFNKTLFDEASVPYPPTKWEEAWTWDQFVETAKKLTKKRSDGRMQYGARVHGAFEQCWGAFVWSNGGDVMNKELTKSTMGDPKAVAAIQFLVDLIHNYQVSPKPGDPSVYIEGAPSPFEAGLVAMNVDSSAYAGGYSKITAFEPHACVLPKAPNGTTCCSFNGNPNCIPASSKVKDAAWKFVSFLGSRPGMEEMGRMKLGMPANKEVCYDANLYLKPPPWDLQVFADGMKIACCNDLRFVRLWLEWVSALESPISLALTGEMGVKEACDKADTDCNKVLERSIAG